MQTLYFLGLFREKFSHLTTLALFSALILALPNTAFSAVYGATQCAATRFGSNLGCTANDVSLNSIEVIGSSVGSCTGGTAIPLDLKVTVNFGNSTRYDIGIFLANDAKSPQLTIPNGGSSTCSVGVLPTSSPFYGSVASGGDGDACGDGGNSLSGSFTMSAVNVTCLTNGTGTSLHIPYVISWDQLSSNTCNNNTNPVPGTTSKCNGGTVIFPPGSTIVVLPKVTVNDGITTIISGGSVTYTIVIDNTTGSTLTNAVFSDPAVTDLSITSVSCLSSGATCPSSLTVSNLQSGITLPSVPPGGVLTFTVVGTYTGTPTSPTTLTNTANITISGQTNSASDTDIVMIAPTASKTFSPATIAPNDTSTLSITLTNPNSVAITGAAYTDTYPSGMTNSSSPALSSTCGGTATAAANGSSISLSGGGIPANGSCTITVQVKASTTGINNLGTVTTTNAGNRINAASSTLQVIPVISSFNAFESSTTSTAITGKIYTKLAGTAFSLDVVAIASGIKATSFNDNVKIELLANTGTAGSGYDVMNCPTSNTVIQTINSTAVSSGRSVFNLSAVASAYKDVRVRISYPTTSPTIINCSNDNFAIRPSAASILTSANAVGPSAIALPTVKTGANFDLRAITSTGTNYAGALTLDTSKLSAQTPSQDTTSQSGGTIGILSPSSLTGNAAYVNATYSEVGYLYLAAGAYRDDTYTSVDNTSDDCISSTSGDAYLSDTLSSEKYGCSIGNKFSVSLGRFIPDHFEVTVNSNGSMKAFCGTPGFTYTGQSMGYLTQPSLTIKPMSAATGGIVTQNYRLSFQTLTASGVSITSPINDTLQLGRDATSKTELTATLGVGTIINSSGTMTYTLKSDDAFIYTRNANALISPYTTSIALAVASISDGITSATGAMPTLYPTGVSMRYGRLNLYNAYGSDKLNLVVRFETQYWNGYAFVKNTADSCTSISANNIGFGSPTGLSGYTPSVSSISFSGGVGEMTIPTSGIRGSVDLVVDLGATEAPINTTNNSWVATQTPISGAGMEYLRGRWYGSDYDRDPTARITFGISGKKGQIYIRESY